MYSLGPPDASVPVTGAAVPGGAWATNRVLQTRGLEGSTCNFCSPALS